MTDLFPQIDDDTHDPPVAYSSSDEE
jgi:hypothetical protein